MASVDEQKLRWKKQGELAATLCNYVTLAARRKFFQREIMVSTFSLFLRPTREPLKRTKVEDGKGTLMEKYNIKNPHEKVFRCLTRAISLKAATQSGCGYPSRHELFRTFFLNSPVVVVSNQINFKKKLASHVESPSPRDISRRCLVSSPNTKKSSNLVALLCYVEVA